MPRKVKLIPIQNKYRTTEKEVTAKEIMDRLGEICPRGSFRTRALECGIMEKSRTEVVAGRKTTFFPAGSAEVMWAHIMARKEQKERARQGKAA
jgi:hypothetical protein